jgi:competence protein ComEC
MSWTSSLFVIAIPVLWMSVRGRSVAAVTMTAAAVLAFLASTPLDPLPDVRLTGDGVMATDVIDGRYGPYALVEMEGGPILVNLPPGANGSRGEVVRLEGSVTGEPGTIWGRRHRGAVRVTTFEVLHGPTSPIMTLGNAMRDRVASRLAPLEGGRALLAGFLVGDTDGVDEIDQEAMRRAGLSHFTAVSGSNVALFLGLLFLALGPIGVGPRRRAVVGLVGLPIFAAATRFEPSVLRASAMAGLALGGRLIGVSMEAWQLLSTATIGLILLDPTLATNAGFQLSLAATAGVIVGARWPVPRTRVARALAVTVGAQAAVAPLLILHFGLVPLLSPLANLVAGPIVAVSTLLGAVGMVGPSQLATLGAWLAGLVLWLARIAAGWPQIGWLGLLLIPAALTLCVGAPRLRGVIALATAVSIVFLVVGQTGQAPSPGVVVLDVGQGDSILISGGDGHYALVDGGPDPVVLVESLRRYSVRYLELVVLTHVHSDHAAGLSGLVGRIPIGRVWAATEPHSTSSSDELFRLLEPANIRVERPMVGDQMQVGELSLTVEGPLRRYASPNDQSIVLMVEGPGRSMLLSGDIEVVAQSELGHLRADVLKVPHQGAATSDSDWLENSGAELAVISVGRNDYGHPAGWVIELLEASGAIVRRTDQAGDVLVPLGWETGSDVRVVGSGQREAPARGVHLRDGRDQHVARLEECPYRGPLGRRGAAHGGSLSGLGCDPDRSGRPVVALRKPNYRGR